MRKLLLLLLLWPSILLAQDTRTDSLKAELTKARSDSAKVMAYCALGKHLLLSDAVKAREYSEAAEKLAAAKGFPIGRAKALSLLGSAHFCMGDYGKSMYCQYKALEIGKQLRDTLTMIAAHVNLGNVYHRTKDPERAIKNYLLAGELARGVGDSLKLSKVYNNLGSVHEDKSEYRQALAFYRRAATLQEKSGDKKSLGISLLNIGNVQLLTGQAKEGLPILQEAARLNKEIGNDMILMVCLGRISEAHRTLGNIQEALRYANQSYSMATKVESSKKIAEASKQLQTIHASLGNYQKAYEYLAIHMKHSEAITSENRAKIEAGLTVKYETKQQEVENRRLKEGRKQLALRVALQQKILALSGAAVLLLVILMVVLYVSRKRLKRTYSEQKEAHRQLEAQQKQIVQQKNELSAKSKLLKEQNEELKKHGAFKNRVFTLISHDLRAPLDSLKGILDLLQAGVMSPDEVKRVYWLLGREMEVAGGMLDNVLVWAKAQLGDLQVEMQPLNLYQLTEERIRLAGPYAEKKGLVIINGVPEEAVALADQQRLGFVLHNLLMNAVKFSYAGGEITVTAEGHGRELTLSVSDHGKGIPVGSLPKLFAEKRYTTLGTEGEKGTGIGLMLCKELVESFGGKISVESREGAGSVFSVALPMQTRWEVKEAQVLETVA